MFCVKEKIINCNELLTALPGGINKISFKTSGEQVIINFFSALINRFYTLFSPPNPILSYCTGVSLLNVIIQLSSFTVFIHVHFQTLFQTTSSALVSVSFVYGTTTLYREKRGGGEGDIKRERGYSF